MLDFVFKWRNAFKLSTQNLAKNIKSSSTYFDIDRTKNMVRYSVDKLLLVQKELSA